MQHSRVNGLVSKQTVSEFWKIIVDGARPYAGKDSNPVVKAATAAKQWRTGERMLRVRSLEPLGRGVPKKEGMFRAWGPGPLGGRVFDGYNQRWRLWSCDN